MKCRFCQSSLKDVFIDLVTAPPSNSYLTAEELKKPEYYYPLKVFVCNQCWLVQIDEFKCHDEIFDHDYAYFSSFSSTWLQHCEEYVNMITRKLQLNSSSQVIEVASNDGYLLQYFLPKSIPCLGIEPTANTAAAAREKGIQTLDAFFSLALARQLADKDMQADLLLGNNVLAHVPAINDFVKAIKVILKANGTATMEFPHLLNLIKFKQFDTIYHEHYSYFSFHTVCEIFSSHALQIYDVEELPTHGGSLRIYATHFENKQIEISSNVQNLLDKEKLAGILKINTYKSFQAQADSLKYHLLNFLTKQKKAGKTVAAYGAAAKGNTLLNYCGIKADLLQNVADLSPHKQGKYLPGSRIPVVSQKEMLAGKPDFVIILPWNLKEEISQQLASIREWGGQFVTAVPNLEVF